jgi:hypothetical protein
MGVPPEATVLMHSQLWLLYIQLLWEGLAPTLTTSDTAFLYFQYFCFWIYYLLVNLLHWVPTAFEVNEHPIGNNKSTSYRVGLLTCRPSSRFRSLMYDGLKVRDMHLSTCVN